MKIIYITHDGLTDHIGQSQILPYILDTSLEHDFWVISVEKDLNNVKMLRETFSHNKNIHWTPIRYPSSSIFGFFLESIKMIYISVKTIIHNKVDIIHCRCYPGIFIGVVVKLLTFFVGPRLLFDIRDFWLDSRIDTRKNKFIYRFLKLFEKFIYRISDGYVILTENAKKHIQRKYGISENGKKSITVIPCCADFEHFNPKRIKDSDKSDLRNKLNLNNDDFVIGYLGSLGPDYLINEMLDVFYIIKSLKNSSVFLMVTNTVEYARKKIQEDPRFTNDDFRIICSNRSMVPSYISLFNLSLVFIRPAFSKSGCSPTKVAELLSMNVPVLANEGVGDLNSLLSMPKNSSTVISLPIDEHEIKSFIEFIDRNSEKEFIRNNSKDLTLQNGARLYLSAYNSLYD